MVFLIYGPETYKRDFEVKKLTKNAVPVQANGLEPSVRSALEASSLFGKSVAVIRKELFGAEEELFKYLKQGIPDNDLIISTGSVNTNTKIFKWIQKNGKVIECRKLSREELERQFAKGMKALNCKMTVGAMNLLIDRSGYLQEDDITMYKMNIYLKQLAFRTDCIGEEDVRAIVPEYEGEEARRLLDHLVNGKHKEMMDLAVSLMDRDKQAIMYYGLMLRNLRIAYKASLYPEKSDKELGKLLGLRGFQMRGVENVRRLHQKTIVSLMDIIIKGTNDVKEGLMPARESFLCTVGEMIQNFNQEENFKYERTDRTDEGFFI